MILSDVIVIPSLKLSVMVFDFTAKLFSSITLKYLNSSVVIKSFLEFLEKRKKY